MAGQPPFYPTPQEFKAKVDEYFSMTDPDDYTITGIALYLGFESRQSFYDYEEREGFSYIVKTARLRVENGYELDLKKGKKQATGAIFALKNMGWRDKFENEVSGGMVVNWQEEKTYETK